MWENAQKEKSMSKKIPVTMMTQHPDSASMYVSIQDEPAEAVLGLKPPPGGLGIDEVMVDYEGKLTPYHQTSQVVHGLHEAGLVAGSDVAVTPRVASATKETTFKQLMALLSVVETNYLAETEYKGGQAVTEVILPMVASPEEVLDARKRIEHVIQLAHDEFGVANDKNAITVIPIVEEVPQLIGLDRLLGGYMDLCEKEGFSTSRVRYMLARSDPALSYGLVSAVLAVKIAVSRGYETARAHGVEVAPILGAGSLPFRGHITPGNIKNILREYSGVRTITVQSALRYDHPKEDLLEMIDYLDGNLQSTEPLAYSPDEYERMINYIGVFTRAYVEGFLKVCSRVSRVSDLIPKQRDRLARKSPVGYARDFARPELLAEAVSDRSVAEELKRLSMDQQLELPRAITYTAALYSVGFPPELIGTGRALKEIVKRYGKDGLEDLLGFYPSMPGDMEAAGRFLNTDCAVKFLGEEAWGLLAEDVKGVEEVLEVELGPVTDEEKQHRTLMDVVGPVLKIYADEGLSSIPGGDQEVSVVRDCLVRMGKLRKSLG